MAPSRGLDRLLAFSDATVAIAITLLVLPLVDIAQEAVDHPVGDLLDDHSFELTSAALVNANLLWLVSIMFLPFPTEPPAADHDQRLTHGMSRRP